MVNKSLHCVYKYNKRYRKHDIKCVLICEHAQTQENRDRKKVVEVSCGGGTR